MTKDYQAILELGLFDCCDEPLFCLAACFFPECANGYVTSLVDLGFCTYCCCYICCAGCGTAKIKDRLLGRNNGCCIEWILHYFCYSCKISQNWRAVSAWTVAGRPAANSQTAPAAVAM